MKANLTPGPEDGPEREALRSFLRHWSVGAPPRDLEEDLRRTFRRRRQPARRPVVWLALAAGIALVVLSQVVRTQRPAPPESPVVVASPRPVPAAPPESSPAVDGTEEAAVVAPPARVRRDRIPSPVEPEVIVEANQAELLATLGRELRAVQREAPRTAPLHTETVAASAPETPIPQMPATEVPAYRATWEAVEGEWPFVHRAVPGSGR